MNLLPPEGSLERMTIFDFVSVLTHLVAFVLGLVVLYKFQDLFTKKHERNKRVCFSFIDFIYAIIAVSTIANIMFIGKICTFWYSETLATYSKMEYMLWMVYHSVAGFVTIGFYVCVDKVLTLLVRDKGM